MKNQFFECKYPVTCDTYNCRKPAKWFIGRPDGPVSMTWKLCDDCAHDLIRELPSELQTKKPHECPDCDESFDSMKGLKIHMSTTHREVI